MSADPFAPLRLDGRVVLVTGATQGLGAAIARRCRDLGACLVLTGRDAGRGEAIRAELAAVAPRSAPNVHPGPPHDAERPFTAAGDGVVFVPAELRDPDAVRGVVAAAEERFGRLDGLVCAAGLSTRGTLDSTSVELWDDLFAVNARAPFVLLQAAAPLMRRTGGGSVVNVITMAAHGGEPALLPYSASKAALATLTRNAGYALQPDRIRVNGLNIGWTLTDGEHVVQTGEGAGEDWVAAADAGRPLGRLLRPAEDIAPMVCHLLSDAAAMVTGSVIDWDQTVLGPYGEHAVPAEAVA